MPKSASVPVVTKREAARRDLVEHFVYLAENASLDIADRFLANAEASFNDLARQPTMGAALVFKHPDLTGLRKWRVKRFNNHLVFYLSRPDGWPSCVYCTRQVIGVPHLRLRANLLILNDWVSISPHPGYAIECMRKTRRMLRYFHICRNRHISRLKRILVEFNGRQQTQGSDSFVKI